MNDFMRRNSNCKVAEVHPQQNNRINLIEGNYNVQKSNNEMSANVGTSQISSNPTLTENKICKKENIFKRSISNRFIKGVENYKIKRVFIPNNCYIIHDQTNVLSKNTEHIVNVNEQNQTTTKITRNSDFQTGSLNNLCISKFQEEVYKQYEPQNSFKTSEQNYLSTNICNQQCANLSENTQTKTEQIKPFTLLNVIKTNQENPPNIGNVYNHLGTTQIRNQGLKQPYTSNNVIPETITVPSLGVFGVSNERPQLVEQYSVPEANAFVVLDENGEEKRRSVESRSPSGLNDLELNLVSLTSDAEHESKLEIDVRERNGFELLGNDKLFDETSSSINNNGFEELNKTTPKMKMSRLETKRNKNKHSKIKQKTYDQPHVDQKNIISGLKHIEQLLQQNNNENNDFILELINKIKNNLKNNSQLFLTKNNESKSINTLNQVNTENLVNGNKLYFNDSTEAKPTRSQNRSSFEDIGTIKKVNALLKSLNHYDDQTKNFDQNILYVTEAIISLSDYIKQTCIARSKSECKNRSINEPANNTFSYIRHALSSLHKVLRKLIFNLSKTNVRKLSVKDPIFNHFCCNCGENDFCLFCVVPLFERIQNCGVKSFMQTDSNLNNYPIKTSTNKNDFDERKFDEEKREILDPNTVFYSLQSTNNFKNRSNSNYNHDSKAQGVSINPKPQTKRIYINSQGRVKTVSKSSKLCKKIKNKYKRINKYRTMYAGKNVKINTELYKENHLSLNTSSLATNINVNQTTKYFCDTNFTSNQLENIKNSSSNTQQGLICIKPDNDFCLSLEENSEDLIDLQIPQISSANKERKKPVNRKLFGSKAKTQSFTKIRNKRISSNPRKNDDVEYYHPASSLKLESEKTQFKLNKYPTENGSRPINRRICYKRKHHESIDRDYSKRARRYASKGSEDNSSYSSASSSNSEILHARRKTRLDQPRNREHQTSRCKKSSDPTQQEHVPEYRRRGFLYKEECFRILNTIYNTSGSGPFRSETRQYEFPDYCKVVSYPICMDVIACKLRQGIYTRLSHFISDMRRLFWNWRLYVKKVYCRFYIHFEKIESLFEYLLRREFPGWDFSDISGSPTEPFRTNKHEVRTTKRLDVPQECELPRYSDGRVKVPMSLRKLFG